MPSVPPRPAGSTREAIYHQSVYDQVHGPAGQLNSSATVKVSRGTKGSFLRVVPAKGGGVKYIPYQVQEHLENALRCRSWDGETAGDTDVYIAKPPELRFSVLTEDINGTTATYSDFSVDDQSRSVNFDSEDNTQFIIQPYLVGDTKTIIYAVKCKTFTPDPSSESDTPPDLTLMDANVAGRAWGQEESP